MVRGVTPGDVGAVSCVNTNIEVDILEVDGAEGGGGGSDGTDDKVRNTDGDTAENVSKSTNRGGGYSLSDTTADSTNRDDGNASATAARAQHDTTDLPNEHKLPT